jgi:hypothetical protein
VNNIDKLFYIEKWNRQIPFGWLESEDLFVQDLGLIYQMSDGGDHGHLYTDTMTLLTFNGEKVNAELLMDILDENVTSIENKEIFVGPNCKEKAQSPKKMFFNNRLYLPHIGMPTQVLLYNSRGQNIFSRSMKSSTLQLLGLAPGVYYYRIITANNTLKGVFLVPAR